MAVLRQVANFLLRTVSMIAIARLVTPHDFGLFGMSMAFLGILGLFRDAGLAIATVQSPTISRAQTSTLFYINLAVGAALAAICLALAPLLSAFYNEPLLLWITAALGIGFLFDGLGAQHRALLQRGMRFGTLAVIDTAALALNITIGIAMGLAGFGYWVLVAMWIALPAFGTLGAWLATGWLPGRPQRGTGLRPMLHLGGVMSLHGLATYVGYNADKVLLGRFWGPEVLGVYGRAYQLVSLPGDNLNAIIGSVMFPALSRVQDDPARLRRYFLASYSLYLALVMPVTLACAVFADDLVLVLLGPQWHAAANIFRLLTPTMIVFALINPFVVLLQSSGLALRTLRISLVIAPVVIAGYALGLGSGAQGVALGFSLAMLALALPVLAWSRSGTAIGGRDLATAALFPLLSCIATGVLLQLGHGSIMQIGPPLARLTAGTALLFALYLLILLLVFGKRHYYAGLLRSAGAWPFAPR